MEKVYTSVLINQSLGVKFNDADGLVEEFSLDGIVHHSNRSCKSYCFGLYDLSRMTAASRHPVPDFIFDGDQTDARNFSWAQFENRFQSFMETLEMREVN